MTPKMGLIGDECDTLFRICRVTEDVAVNKSPQRVHIKHRIVKKQLRNGSFVLHFVPMWENFAILCDQLNRAQG